MDTLLHNEAPYIKGLPVFYGLSCDETQKLGYTVVERDYSTKQLIFSTEHAVEYIYLVREGRVKLYRVTEDGRENIIAILGPGDVFGEFVFGETICHSVNAEAFENASICILTHTRFMQMLLAEPAIAIRVLTNVGKRLAQSAHFIENLSTYNIKMRFGKLLLCLASEYADGQEEQVVLKVRLTHQDLAYMVATCRQTITELVNQFRRDKLIAYYERHIVVMRPALSEWIRDHSLEESGY